MIAPPLDIGGLLRSPDEASLLRGVGLAWTLSEGELRPVLERAAVPCPTFEGSVRVPLGVVELAALAEVSWLGERKLTVQLPEGGADLEPLSEFPNLDELCVIDPASHPPVRGLEALPISTLRWLDLGTERQRLPLPAGMKPAAAGAWRPGRGRLFRR